jgi:micrococcal nuclease
MSSASEIRIRSKLYYYAAEVKSVYDGDTITVDLDLGLGLWRRHQTIRFWKVSAPEVRGSAREKGLIVRDFVRDLILGKNVLLRTILDKRGQDRTGKFGRLLGEVLMEGDEGDVINLNELLIEKGMAAPLGEDGSSVRSLVLSRSVDTEMSATILCRYCGEVRQVNEALGVVEICPNCLDPAYPLL